MSHVLQLGYLAFEVSSLAAWRSFAEQTLGLTFGEELPSGGFTLRMDHYPQRVFIEPGPLDDACAIGWQVADRAALQALAQRLPEHRVGTPEECARRKVAALIKFDDPSGIPTEV